MSQAAQWYDVPAPASEPLTRVADQHVPEMQLPTWMSDHEPPPPTEADRGGAHDTVAHPRMAAPLARAEVEALLAAIEADYPL